MSIVEGVTGAGAVIGANPLPETPRDLQAPSPDVSLDVELLDDSTLAADDSPREDLVGIHAASVDPPAGGVIIATPNQAPATLMDSRAQTDSTLHQLSDTSPLPSQDSEHRLSRNSLASQETVAKQQPSDECTSSTSAK